MYPSPEQPAAVNGSAVHQSYEDSIAEVLGRYSVLDLREMSRDDLARGDAMFDKNGQDLVITAAGEENMIRWWKIRGTDEYEVRRFENFVFCSCRDFFFKKTVCKHIALSTTAYCADCRSRECDVPGGKCTKCSPGGILDVGDCFRMVCHSYKKRSVFQVIETQPDGGVTAIDLSEPDNRQHPRSKHFFPKGFDSQRKSGVFKLLPPNFGQSEEAQHLADSPFARR